MKSPVQIAKVKAVILYVMQNFLDGVDYIKLFKILYFAQQGYLVRYGKILRVVKHGPASSSTYKALQVAEGKSLEGDFTIFLNGIKARGKKVYTSASPDMDYVSGADKKYLDAAIEKC